ncbi:GTPase EngC [Beutenbergia cavernae DSM 12333]|uniref:Small ribosomal subunit biogenesis GTPase RsgA n=1 Tax=Beutenbergia cavernae (strain ATCC BAA-8 / DSM 12333 / CCUG 43141 / JCM 11478 / NBRC 16432 / NCIMB 13614 / HKI 0122) TaxID=471853 RepID=C5C2S6_BEUC1|nr:ribosome small subunit-dependent GTPase A [Beutenbergia cavernae]ACQ81770.1 GTPase EngC [Beutenbergia cavernae DSM 12333]
MSADESADPGSAAPGRWLVSRVDRQRVRALPLDDGGAFAPGDGTTVVTDRDGTLPAAVGEPLVPAVGDVLLAAPTPELPDRVLVAPRRSELARDSADRTSREQVIAANVDVVVIAEHLDPDPAVGRVERLLTLAWRSGATPLVVLTKADLVDDAADWVADVGAVALGVDVLAVSATTGLGMSELRERIAPGTTLVVVGPSGAGKSTLVNALAGTEVMATGDRRGDGKGRHTTSHRELVPLPGGATLIDTPGLRAVGLVATPDAVAKTFSDVEDLVAQCRFSDCAHDTEPGCAVLAAVEDGTLDERRLASWRSLQREMLRQAARSDARIAAQQRDVWKKRVQGMREYQRARGR